MENMLPSPIDGFPYAHEFSDPTPIPEAIRPQVLELLRSYHTAVYLNITTLSEASQTSVPAQSEASTGTSLTNLTLAFSAFNGSVQQEPARKSLDPVSRARKALMRKLQACREDCRARRVKCKLFHHALRDLLQSPHEPGDEKLVAWAIRFDAEPQAPVVAPSVSARGRAASFVAGASSVAPHVIVNQANNIFDVSSAMTMPYPSEIQETTASLLEPPERLTPRSRTPADLVGVYTPSFSYCTSRNDRMIEIGERDDRFGPPHYNCRFSGCTQIALLQDLISHYERTHLYFERLQHPLRMVCATCDGFNSQSIGQCWECHGSTLIEKVYGMLPPDWSGTDPTPGNGTVPFGLPGWRSFAFQGANLSQYQGSGLYGGNTGPGYPNNSSNGDFMNQGGYYFSYARSIAAYLKHSLRSHAFLIRLPYQLFRQPVRGRRLTIAFVLAFTISLAFSFEKHDWILSKLAWLIHGASTLSHLNVPFVGVVLASLAFGVHRIFVRAHRATGRQRNGWFSRCALNVFNVASVACGRRASEASSYELVHSRSYDLESSGTSVGDSPQSRRLPQMRNPIGDI